MAREWPTRGSYAVTRDLRGLVGNVFLMSATLFFSWAFISGLLGYGRNILKDYLK